MLLLGYACTAGKAFVRSLVRWRLLARWRLCWLFCRLRCAGSALAIFWFVHIGAGDFSGDVLATAGYYVGDVLAIFGRFVGDALPALAMGLRPSAK